MEKGFCQKDNLYVIIEKGCLHPNDYCQHRTACIIHFVQKEKEYEEKRKNLNNQNQNKEK
jgi:hypothetical protein